VHVDSTRPAAPRDAAEAEDRVLAWLGAHPGGAVVALSGGADSALLLSLAAEALGPGAVIAATSRSESLPAEELADARAQAANAGVEHVVLKGSETEIEAFRRNGPDRCFHCKDHLYGEMTELARSRGLAHVYDGTNADDVEGHRPGFAAGQRHGVRSPLLECGLTKPWVRAVSRRRGLATWDKPSEACLSSRIPYGTEVTPETLDRVERAERALKALGFRTVRVRVHDPVARIEVPTEDLPALLQPGVRERAIAGVRAAGFAYVALDLDGYRSGSLNEPLRPPEGARPAGHAP
jgi:pyridinium-3,5-biscarboxylic acid mononucleotide sulfurtransferase